MSTVSTSDSKNVANVEGNINKTKETNIPNFADPHNHVMDTNMTITEKPWIRLISRIHDVLFKTDATNEKHSNENNLSNTLNYYYVSKESYPIQEETLLDTLTVIDLGSEAMCLLDMYKEDMLYNHVEHDKNNPIVKHCKTTDE